MLFANVLKLSNTLCWWSTLLPTFPLFITFYKFTGVKRKFQKACCYFDLMPVFALCRAVVLGLNPAYTYLQGQILCISFLYSRVVRRNMLLCRCLSGCGKQWRILIVGATEIVVKCPGPIIRLMLANAYKPSIYNYKGCDV